MITIAICLSVSLISDLGAAIYKCEVDGKISFTDRPCEQGYNDKQFKLPRGTSSDTRSPSGVPVNWFTGYDGYKKALNVSRASNAPILIYFKADWCRYCKKLERELLETRIGKEALKDVVKVRIKPEDNSANDEFYRKLGGRGYPTILVQTRGAFRN